MIDPNRWRAATEIPSRHDERARNTLESIGDAVITTDVDCAITYMNAVAERLTGWSGEEAIGLPLDEVLPLFQQTSRDPVPNTARRCLMEGRSIDLEPGVVLVRRDGTEIALADSAAPVRTRGGTTTGVVLVLRDESEKRRVGNQLSHEATHDALARFGGDEFAVVVENCPLSEARRIAEVMRSTLATYCFTWEGRDFSIRASFGLVPITAQHAGMSAVLKASDTACYAAKERGGNCVFVGAAGPDVAAQSPGESRQITRLTQAIAEGQFLLYAQPIVPLQPAPESRPRFEILLRLPDPNGLLQDASRFLPHAERYQLMPAIDRWVLVKTIGLLGQWHQEHPHAELPICSINLSTSAIMDSSLLPLVHQLLERAKLPAHALCFEFKESSALTDLRTTTAFFSAIRELGCGIALEDCGNDVNAFGRLRLLPVNYLKIGGRFVNDVAADPMCGSIVQGLHQVGRSIGMSTIAKQVGSTEAVEALRTMGIGYAQGLALSAPAPFTGALGQLTMPAIAMRTQGVST